MVLSTELTSEMLLDMLKVQADELSKTNSESEFLSVAVKMQKTLAIFIADRMQHMRESEGLTLDDIQYSTNRWLITALQDDSTQESGRWQLENP